MTDSMGRKVGIGLMVAVLALTSIFVLWHLGNEPLQDYDEATYAQVVHESLADGNFISFTYGGADYFNKPPLMFWLMGASESVLGETPFAMRLPFAIFGIALVGIIMALAFEVSVSYIAAACAGAVAMTTGPLMETARQVRMDVPVTFFIMAAVYCFVRGLRNSNWFLAFGACVGLAVMCKSVIAIFACAAAFFILTFFRRFDVLKDKKFWYGIGIFLLVAAPWHIAETLLHGMAFWQQYIGQQVVDRTQMNLFWTVTITNTDLWNYVQEFYVPWLAVLAAAVVVFVLRRKSLPEQTRAFIYACIVTFACILAVFLVSATKAPTYLMPLYPFAALIIALAFVPSPNFKKHRIFFGGCIAGALCIWGGIYAVYNVYHYNGYYKTTLDMAVDEKAIGQQLAQIPAGTKWYVYSDTNLGSIMFYSQHLQTLALSTSTGSIPQGSYIVADSNATAQLKTDFPNVSAMPLYVGPQVTLLRAQ